MDKVKQKNHKDKYTLQFKLEAVRLVKGGQTLAATAKVTVQLEQSNKNSYYSLSYLNNSHFKKIMRNPIHSSARHFPTRLVVGALVTASLFTACGGDDDTNPAGSTPVKAPQNSYSQQTFVANKQAPYKPEVATEPEFIDAWGIAIRPAGVPGHFWVLAGNKSYEYAGDVTGRVVAPCIKVSALCADLAPLASNQVTIPDFPTTVDDSGAVVPDIAEHHATGVVFNANPNSFVVTQTPTTGAAITAGAKFLFATSFGTISAWTERKKADGSFERPASAVTVIDQSAHGAGFYGLAVSPDSSRLYVADFGADLKVKVFDPSFKEIANAGFKNPFVSNQTAIKAGDFAPWNVQVLNNHVFVTYAQLQENPDPKVPRGQAWPGNEVHAATAGRLAEFDLDGKLISVWNDAGLLNAPWGLAIAPADFGALSNTLLVANFGDYDGVNTGAIVAFDMTTRKAVNYLRGPDGKPVLVPGIWGMVFGNGDTLGDTNALYFAAGPEDEADGVFGSLRYKPTP
jgi:uncharacterized protein (TIGR03118 family)